jgi:hypothetical protein
MLPSQLAHGLGIQRIGMEDRADAAHQGMQSVPVNPKAWKKGNTPNMQSPRWMLRSARSPPGWRRCCDAKA